MTSLSRCCGSMRTPISCSGSPSTTSRSANAPGDTTPTCPSRRSKRAATVVAERKISAGGCTWRRSVNSLSCSSCMQASIQDIEHFPMSVFRQPKFASARGQGGIGRQGRHIKGSARLEEGKAAFVHEVAMFDTAHAALQAAIDRPRGIGVSSDIEVGCLGFLDGGTDLLTRELDRINSIRWRSDPATQHELEMGCTTSDLLSGCLAHFIGSITDGSQGGAAVTEIIRLPARTAKIAMPSRLRERFAAKDEAWPLQVALFDGLCQTILGSAHIAHRREAAPQHAHQHAGRSRLDIGRGPLGKP